MHVVAKKLATLRRVVRTQGVAGIASVLSHKIHSVGDSAKGVYESARVAPAVWAASRRFGRPRLLLAYFGGIGDDLLMTVALRELRRRAYRGTWMLSEYPELFRHNDDAEVVLPWDGRYVRAIRLLGWPLVSPWYSRYIEEGDRDLPPPRHIVSMMCEKVGIVGPVTLKPHLVLTDEELARGKRAPRQIAIQSSGMTARFKVMTKQWFAERYQEVVTRLRGDFHFVQLGARADPPIEGALDLRGRTSLRESAAVLARSLAFVGPVGFLMHLARAVDCRGVIVYGGRELPSQSGYSCNENLAAAVPCAPCWKLNTCEYDRACMRQIEPADVVRAIERQVARHGQPLAVDTDVITHEGTPARTDADGRTFLAITDVFRRTQEIEAKFLPGVDRAAALASAAGRAPRPTASLPVAEPPVAFEPEVNGLRPAPGSPRSGADAASPPGPVTAPRARPARPLADADGAAGGHELHS